jgi:sugar phosphate isomerase/epimerase
MRFAICNEIFRGWEPRRAFAFAREAGYEAIEIAPFTIAPLVTDISAEKRCELRDAAAESGISISGIHWVLAHTEGMHVNHPDPEWRKRARDYLAAAVDFCSDLGGTHMIFGSPKRRDILAGVTREQADTWTLETFTPATRKAEQLGVTICLEPLSPSETNYLNTAADTIWLANRMESPAFRIMLDTKAMCSEISSIPEIIAASAGQFAYFHANDRNLKGPGFGDVDFAPIATVLRGVGYRGYVSVEVFVFDEGPEVIATKSREYLGKTFGLSGD